MLCSFVRKTSITNPRLDCVHVVLWLGMLAFCIRSFVVDKGYTKDIVSSIVPEIEIKRTGPLEADATVAPLCKNGTNQSAFVYECPNICNATLAFTWSNRTSCVYRSELIATATFNEVQLILSNSAVQKGLQVEAKHGVKKVGHYNFTQIAALPLTIDYINTLNSAVPHVLGFNNMIRPIYTAETAAFVVLDRGGHIWKTFEPGSQVTMTAAEILWLADSSGKHMDFIEDMNEGGNVPFQVTADNFYGTQDKFPLWVFFSGADVGGQISCFNNDHDAQSIARRKFRASFSKPVCILRLQLYATHFESSVKVIKEVGLHTLSRSSILKLQLHGTAGRFRVWDYSAILSHVISLLVLMRLPAQAVQFIAFNLLGHLSTLYKRAAIHVFDLQQQCGAVAVQLVQGASHFRQLADVQDYDGEGSAAISEEKLAKSLKEALQSIHDLDDSEMSELSAFCYRTIVQGPSSEAAIGTKEYQHACFLNQDIDLHSIVRLFDANRRRSPGEMIFMPGSLRRALQSSLEAQASGRSLVIKDETENSCGLNPNHANGAANATSWQEILDEQVKGSCKPIDDKVCMLTDILQVVQEKLGNMFSKLEAMENRIERVEFSLLPSSICEPECGTNQASGLKSNPDEHEPLPFGAAQQIQQPDGALEDCTGKDDTCNIKFLESSVLAMQQKLEELGMRQTALIEEAVMRANAVAVAEVRSSLSAAMTDLVKQELDGALSKQECQPAFHNTNVDKWPNTNYGDKEAIPPHAVQKQQSFCEIPSHALRRTLQEVCACGKRN